jgi:CHAT domain-containing protein/tetratricopeptide (TPR) repeat protein
LYTGIRVLTTRDAAAPVGVALGGGRADVQRYEMMGWARAMLPLAAVAGGLVGDAPAAAEPRAEGEASAALEALRGALARGEDASVLEGATALLRRVGAGDAELSARALTLRGVVLADRGRFEDARAELDAGLALLGPAGSEAARVEALVAKSQLERASGDPLLARALLDEAARWLGVGGTRGDGAEVELSRAILALAAGREPDARRAIDRFNARCAEPVCEAVSDRLAGRLARLEGHLERAAESLRASEVALARAGRVRERLEVLIEQIEVDRALGDLSRARAAAEVGAGLAARVGHRRLGAEFARLRGELSLEAGHAQAAVQLLEEARGLYTAMRARSGVAGSRLALGRAAAAQGRAEEARIHFEAARLLYVEMADAVRLRAAWRGLAEAARALRDEAGERTWQLALAEDAAPGGRWRPAMRLAELAAEVGALAEARRWLGECVADLEAQSPRLGTPGARSVLGEARQRAYGLLVEAWLGDSQVERPLAQAEALQAAEGALTAGFSELLERAIATRAVPGAEELGHRVAAIDRAMAIAADGDPGFDAETLYRLGQQRGVLEREWRRLTGAELRGAGPREAAARWVAALTGALREDVALLVYHLGAERSRAFVVTGAGVEVVALAGRAEIEALTGDFHDRMRARPADLRERRARERASRRLYEALLAPVVPHLGRRSRVVIVPHGALRIVPFDALVTSEVGPVQFALQRFTFSQVPSLGALTSLWQDARRRSARTDRYALVAFADPAYRRDGESQRAALRGAALEVEVARRRLGADDGPGTLFVGAAATERTLTGLALDRYAVVHLATHGTAGDSIADGKTPALFFGPGDGEDGILRLDEVLRLRLDADLVVLSACDSARGDLAVGDGFDGLTGAFLRAGASEVVATLWEVEDTVTPAMMDWFYEGLARGDGAAAALRRARLAALKGQLERGAEATAELPGDGAILARARDPFYWAPFVLVGTSGDVFR